MVCTRRKNYNTPSITIERKNKKTQLCVKSKLKLKSKNRNSMLLKTNNSKKVKKIEKDVPLYVYRQIKINEMTDFDNKLKKVQDLRYLFYIIKGEDTKKIMVGRTHTRNLKNKFCSLLNNHNDIVNTTDARIYLVLSDDEQFIRELNIGVYTSLQFSCIVPFSWKGKMKDLEKIIEFRDKYIQKYDTEI